MEWGWGGSASHLSFVGFRGVCAEQAGMWKSNPSPRSRSEPSESVELLLRKVGGVTVEPKSQPESHGGDLGL